MEQQFYELVAEWGIFAVFALCTVEGDITLLLSGVLAHSEFFGHYSFLKVIFFGTLGGIVGDCFGFMVGRIFHENAKDYRFYQVAQPRVEKLVEKFGGFAIIISKYIYGIRVAVVVSYGVGKMSFLRFLGLSSVSCFLWVTILSGIGYFFSGAITSIIGDYQRIGVALFVIVMVGVIAFYVIERYWLSERVEDANPETIQMIEEKLLAAEEIGKTTLHDLGERLHLTRDFSKDDKDEIRNAIPEEVAVAEKAVPSD
ncbi:MAG TPA: DedA family protein, partial [Pyrinomonadaceae bacterium]|nr:DedA family protein [Pyrinomonadaceae bacterium]